jgi:tetratricopeptide (TPR) repeat protein
MYQYYLNLVKEGDEMHKAERYTESLLCYLQAYSLNNEAPDVLVKIGSTFLKIGEPDSALTYLNKALAINTHHLGGLSIRGICNIQLEHYKNARKDLLLLKRLSPDSPMHDTTNYLLTLAEEKIKEEEAAAEGYRSINWNKDK